MAVITANPFAMIVTTPSCIYGSHTVSLDLNVTASFVASAGATVKVAPKSNVPIAVYESEALVVVMPVTGTSGVVIALGVKIAWQGAFFQN